MLWRARALLCVGLGGCVTPAETIGALPTTSDAATGTADADASTSAATDDVPTSTSEATASDDTSTGAAGPVVRIHVRSTARRWPHTDGVAGQTPRDYSTGIRSLTLIDTSGATPDLRVFDHAPQHVVVSYEDGADTIVAEVAARDLPAATFDRARVALSFIRFTVDATVHVDALSAAGEVAATQVLADATPIDGEAHDLGWWQWIFSGPFGDVPVGGESGSPIQQLPPGGPIQMAIEDGETVVYFDAAILVDPNVTNDVDAVIEVNVHESFRWQDERDRGFAPGVFDARPPTFEPIRKLGVNAYTLGFR